jgi:hypothetical protein
VFPFHDDCHDKITPVRRIDGRRCVVAAHRSDSLSVATSSFKHRRLARSVPLNRAKKVCVIFQLQLINREQSDKMTRSAIGVAFLFLQALTHGLILSNDTSTSTTHANGMAIKNSSIFDDTTKSLEIKLTTTPSQALEEANFLLPESCADYKVRAQ